MKKTTDVIDGLILIKHSNSYRDDLMIALDSREFVQDNLIVSENISNVT